MVQVVVRVAVTLTDRAGGLYASDHGPGGFEAVELMAVAPIYHTRTISSTYTSTSQGGGLNGHYRWCGWWPRWL